MALFENYIEHNLKNLYNNPHDTIKELFNSKFFAVITNGIIETKCPQFALKVVNTLAKISDVITVCEMHKFLTTNKYDGNSCIKFVYNLHKNYLLEHIAKTICNSKQNLNEVRKFIISIVTSIDLSNKFMLKFTKTLYISSLGKLFLESLPTRHMLISITYMDILNLKKSNHVNIKISQTNINSELKLNSELDNILSSNDYEFHVNPVTLNNKYPIYVYAWSNNQKDIITVESLGLFPTIIKDFLGP